MLLLWTCMLLLWTSLNIEARTLLFYRVVMAHSIVFSQTIPTSVRVMNCLPIHLTLFLFVCTHNRKQSVWSSPLAIEYEN